MLCSVALLAFALCAAAQGRAVNISNTWVLPEEGFPVFYRYFRDRISWYEADAVCQFHHANLVTVDTTAQYDAVRAYLKELDISSAVWVGLIRSNPDGDFTWTDYRGLGGDGYWSSAPDPRAAPLCAAADPAADYRWEARACGGPTVASFICELPVPQWALGNEGCMVKALPALTVLYLPESAAVQLNADCGLAGVKRVQCTGNVKREDLLRDLSCAEEDEISSTVSMEPTGATSTVTSENIFTDQDVNEATTEDNTTTEHEDDINQSSTVKPTPLPYITSPPLTDEMRQSIKPNKIYLNKNVDLDASFNNNLQSNDIPKLASSDNFLSSDLSDKLEDDKNMQHKLLHDEFARHGNFETIFTQPTDHFVPPLVMAKAKISDDMTVLSIEEKHAQQLAEQRYFKHLHIQESSATSASSTPEPKENLNKQNFDATDKPLITTVFSTTIKDSEKQNVVKTVVPKKYNDKYYGPKSKNLKIMDIKASKLDKVTEPISSSSTEKAIKSDMVTSTPKTTTYSEDNFEEEPTIDLTVVIKESESINNDNVHSSEIPKLKITQNDTTISIPEIKVVSPENPEEKAKPEISVKIPNNPSQNLTMTHEIIKITIVKEENSSEVPIVFEVTTKMPVFDVDNSSTPITSDDESKDITTLSSSTQSDNEKVSTELIPETTSYNIVTTTLHDLVMSTMKLATENNHKLNDDIDNPTTTIGSLPITTQVNENITADNDKISELDGNTTSNTSTKETDKFEAETQDMFESNTTDTSQTIDDFQSPLLSAANEPIHRPNRSRRPQPPPNRNKFNPFRILG